MKRVRDRVQIECKLEWVNYDPILVNKYRDEKDSVTWHGDSEDGLVPKRPITSLSLGAERYVADIPVPSIITLWLFASSDLQAD